MYQRCLIVTIPHRATNAREKEPSETRQQPHVVHSYSNKHGQLLGALICSAALLEGEGRRHRSTQNHFAWQTEDLETDHRKKDDQLVELRQQHEWWCNVSRPTDHNRTDKKKGVGHIWFPTEVTFDHRYSSQMVFGLMLWTDRTE